MRDERTDRHRVIYQARHGDGTEPHTLVAANFSHALQQAAELAKKTSATVQLFGDGAFIAECPADASVALADLSPDLAKALSSSGLDLVGWRRAEDGNGNTRSSGLH